MQYTRLETEADTLRVCFTYSQQEIQSFQDQLIQGFRKAKKKLPNPNGLEQLLKKHVENKAVQHICEQEDLTLWEDPEVSYHFFSLIKGAEFEL